MKNNTYKNNTFDRRKEEGVCIYCGKMPPRSGKLVCADCTKKRKLVDALRRGQRKGQRKARKPSKKMALDETLREIAQYNKTHGTNYSYGFYNVLKSRGLI